MTREGTSYDRFIPGTFWCLACDLQVQGEELQELGDLGQETLLNKEIQKFLGPKPRAQGPFAEDWELDESFLNDL